MTVTPENKEENTLQQEQINQNPVQQQPVEAKAPESSEEDPNWRAFREARKKDRAEREAAERKALEKEAEVAALKAAMEAAFAKSPTNSVNYGNNPVDHGYHEESEDERIEKKVQAALAAREAQYEQQRIAREHQEYPARLAQTYPDFHQMISQENLDYLDFHYPEVSRPLQRLKDGYDKFSDIYHAVKKFVPNSRNAQRDSAKADVNFNKPKSISSPSITQPGQSVGSSRLTEEKRAANWARMQEAMRSVG